MSGARFTCQIDGCGKAFADQAAKNSHRRDAHGRSAQKANRYSRGKRAPMAGMSPDDVYSFVDALDLPDGAHWAMIEELSGYEPGDFA